MVMNFFLDEPALRLELNKFEIQSEKQMESIGKGGRGHGFALGKVLLPASWVFTHRERLSESKH